ncbi:hypothetical protein ES708_14619 [subsurface metagenome]
MPPPHFSVRDIQQHHHLTGYRLVITTDVPCRLFMRWTLEKPRTHKDPVFKRGAPFAEKVRFCFVEYQDNDQEEAGDTLTHTFIKLDWPGCQTRYFYFWGTVAGEVSPSESPLFSKHRPVFEFQLLFYEPWTYLIPPPPTMALILLEPWTWTPPPPPTMAQVLYEPWSIYFPTMELIFLEPWSHYFPPAPPMEQVFYEPWSS